MATRLFMQVPRSEYTTAEAERGPGRSGGAINRWRD